MLLFYRPGRLKLKDKWLSQHQPRADNILFSLKLVDYWEQENFTNMRQVTQSHLPLDPNLLFYFTSRQKVLKHTHVKNESILTVTFEVPHVQLGTVSWYTLPKDCLAYKSTTGFKSHTAYKLPMFAFTESHTYKLLLKTSDMMLLWKKFQSCIECNFWVMTRLKHSPHWHNGAVKSNNRKQKLCIKNHSPQNKIWWNLEIASAINTMGILPERMHLICMNL